MISLNKYLIKASISERYASIGYEFEFENCNKSDGSNELCFEITISPEAFISGFTASIDGELFIGETKEKTQAKQEYVAAKEKNENAILITQPFADIPNVFQVKTNIDSQSKILLIIHIEQYLKKILNFNTLNVEIVKTFSSYHITPKCEYIAFNIDITDQRGIYDVQLQSEINETSIIERNTMNKSGTLQEIRGKILISGASNELSVKYKVTGEQNEYHAVSYDQNSSTFVHEISDILTDAVVDEKCATESIELNKGSIMIPRRVVFIIDKSGSMHGAKWSNTLSATSTALKRLRTDVDRFCLLFFDSFIELSSDSGMILADDANIAKAIKYVNHQETGGSTNINDALLKAIALIKDDIAILGKKAKHHKLFQNQMIFITDGEPNSGESDTNKIISNVQEQNRLEACTNSKIHIFCFGVGSDSNDSSWIQDLNHSFLKLLAVNNDGFYKRIKKSTCDAQLNECFAILSQPLLSNIRVSYHGINDIDLTQNTFSTLYNGNDLIICGQLKHYKTLRMTAHISATTGIKMKKNDGSSDIKCIQIKKQICMDLSDVAMQHENDVISTNIERIWAYLKLQQMAQQRLMNDDMIEFDELDDDIPLRLAMRYKFVTPWTSMIVVKHKNDKTEQKQEDDTFIIPFSETQDDDCSYGDCCIYGDDDDDDDEDDDFMYDICGGLDDEEDTMILVSGGPNPVQFEIERKHITSSRFCTTIFEGDADASSIEFRAVDAETLPYIIHYFNNYCKTDWNANEWLQNTFNLCTLSQVVSAANYLDIPVLYCLAKRILDEKEKERNEWIDDQMRALIVETKTKTSVVIQKIDELLLVFEDPKNISETELQDFTVSNMVYLIQMILKDYDLYFGIHAHEQQIETICKYLDENKVNGKLFVELIQKNRFVSNVIDFASRMQQNKQSISAELLRKLQQIVLCLVVV